MIRFLKITAIITTTLVINACTTQNPTLPEQPTHPQGAIITEDNTVIFYHNIWSDIKRNMGLE